MKALSVTQLNSYIRNIFDVEELLHHIDVVGEVFGLSQSRGVLYFSLKDENATLPCVCFNPQYSSFLEEGSSVVVTGSPNFYVKGGKLNFNVSKVSSAGLGKLYEEFLKMKEKLEKEGLFDQAHKKEMPDSIKRIGVITSKEGAVLQDIKNVAWRRNPAVDIVLFSTKVQGKDAEIEIAHAIEVMGKYENIDVIVVARGGGSLEDLAAYNTELVARATFNCPKPIVSAVGHETDFTIIDFVSDLRAPTPSAAAELLTINLDEKRLQAKKNIKDFYSAANAFISNKTWQFENQKEKISIEFEKILVKEQNLFEKRMTKFTSAASRHLQERLYNLSIKEMALKKLDPRHILSQGYAKIEQENVPVKIKSQLNLDKEIKIIFSDGAVNAKPIKEEK